MTSSVRQGVFIAIEGPEGAGKSTQVRLLEAWLRESGRETVVTREPGGTPVSERVREVLLSAGDVPARTELLLMLAARASLVDRVIRPALSAGRVVVTDRFHLSTLAYQGYGRQLPLDEVELLNRFATGGLEPDLTVLLDVAPTVGASRRAAAGGRADRIESAGSEFHDRVAEAYRLLADRDDRIVRLDGGPPVAEVQGRVLSLLAERFPETFTGRAG